MEHPLYTIGHSDCDQMRFIEFLRQFHVQVVADVRSSPFSRRNPQFNQEALRHALRHVSIRYVFLGRELGARRAEPECYVNGQAKYNLIEKTEVFRLGLERLRIGMQRLNVALLCAEQDPITCHRMILICKCLRKDNAEIRHIRRDGTYETNQQTETRLLSALGLNAAFANPAVVDQAYRLQAERIAYVNESDSTNLVESDHCGPAYSTVSSCGLPFGF